MRKVTFRPRLSLVIANILIGGAGLPTLVHASDLSIHPSQVGGLAGAAANATATAAARNSANPTAAAPARGAAARPTPQPTLLPTPLPEPTATAITLPTPTAAISTDAAATAPPAEPITVLTFTIPTSPTLQSADLSAPVAQPVTITVSDGPMEGTIIANRTNALVRFFVEGETRDIEPQRSIGIELARPTAVLNLFNCDALLGETQEGCFWDPYLLARDGFYEVISGRDAGALVGLVFREAGTPPVGEVWIQNRTASAEQVYFGTQMYEIPPSGIAEFPVETGGIAVFYLRTCIAGESGSVCEWTTHSGEPGTYYGLIADQWEGSLPGTTITQITLEPVLGSSPTEDSNPVTAQAPPVMVCRLAVPALNVRSGPGLGFNIVKKVRTTGADVATVTVVARTEDGLWFKVDERVVTGGWITSDPGFLTCEGDANALPVVATADPAATTTQAPIAVAPVASEPAADIQAPVAPAAPPVAAPAPAPVAEIVAEAPPAETTEATTETTVVTPTGPAIPPGLALIVVNNGFDQEIRFTLDQRHRVEQGPSEFDLKPGASVSIPVFPGVIQFSASSAWRGISGNAEFLLEPDNQRVIWLVFVPDPGDPGNWVLMF